MKKNIIPTLLLIGLCACNSQQFEKKNVQKPSLELNKSTAQNDMDILKNQEDFLSDVGFKEQFLFNASSKTWVDVHNFYNQAIQKYATAQHLDYLKGALIAALAGEPNSNLKLTYNGANTTKEAIELYAAEIKSLKVKQPMLVLHFLKELSKFWTPIEVKKYAEIAKLWYVDNYPFWLKERDKLKNTATLTISEQGILETYNNLLSSVEQIRTLAN